MSSDKVSISLSLTNPPRRIPIELPSPSPSSKLHELASKATTIPESTIRLIYRGRIIPPRRDDNDVIEDFNLEDGSVIHCIGKPTSTLSAVSTSNNSNSAAKLDSGSSATVSTGSVVTPPPSNSAAAAAATVTRSNEFTTSENKGQHPLTQALQTMKRNHPQSEYSTALNTLSKILSNIINNPMEEKYRKVKRSNAAFTKRLGRLTNSHEVMMTIGFTTTTSSSGDQDEYTLVPSAEAWPKLTQCKQLIDDEIHNSSSNNDHNIQQQSTSSPSSIPDLGFGAIPPSSSQFGGGLPSMATNPSQAFQMMDATLSNPAALQSMLSNPMIQQMIMNDPRMRNNPMMQNAMRDFMNNPNMIQQMSQMMNDPTVRSSINAMMQQQQSFGGNNNSYSNNAFANGNNSLPNMDAQMEMMRQFANMNGIQSQQQSNSTATNSSNSNNNSSTSNQQHHHQQQQNQGGGNDTNARNDGDNEMSEEEMIAEAIARSLREQ